MLMDIIDAIIALFSFDLSDFRRKPHVRKVLKKEGLKLTRREYAELCLSANLQVNEKMIMPNTRLEDGVHIIQVYAGGYRISFWVEVYKKKVRAYAM